MHSIASSVFLITFFFMTAAVYGLSRGVGYGCRGFVGGRIIPERLIAYGMGKWGTR